MVLNCDTWPTPTPGDCVAGCTIPDPIDPNLLASASEQAGIILRTLSGGRVGTCSETLRPLAECPSCRGLCRCADSGDRIRLFSSTAPVTSVEEVTIDGVIVAPATWRFYPSGQLLYRVPPDVWPNQDRKWADCSQPETMCVGVTVGFEPDAWALAVHAELTCELLKACTGAKDCRIPANATAVNAQGISITLSPDDVHQFLPSVASWVSAINPQSATSLGRVFSPDLVERSGSGCGC